MAGSIGLIIFISNKESYLSEYQSMKFLKLQINFNWKSFHINDYIKLLENSINTRDNYAKILLVTSDNITLVLCITIPVYYVLLIEKLNINGVW